MKSNLFNLSHEVSLSCNQGELIPIGLMEAVPGDTFRHHVSSLIRVQPLLAPLMARCTVKVHHWFVPFRIIWDDFEDFWTGGPNGTNNSVPPYITTPASTGFAVGSLADYLGVVPGVPSVQVSALPFRAMATIWNEFYRDQDLQTPLVVSKASGADTTTSVALQNSCWEKDYFTSARPEPQKGTDVTIPLTGNAPVVTTSGTQTLRQLGSMTTINNSSVASAAAGTLIGNPGGVNAWLDMGTTQEADLSGVTAVSLIDLRLAAALQRYKENMMRFGSRFWERLRVFGVPPMDARYQIPEYLGGGKQVIQFSEVLQTAEGTDPVGEMRGHGIAALKSNAYKKYVPEPGLIISLMTVRPKTMYPQAVNRMYLYKTKEDFYQPELQHVGQQEVYDGEVYMGAASQYDTWGYQDRYDHLRRMESRVAGEFRDTLKYWHMGRLFANEAAAALNADFVKCVPRTDVYSAPAADQLYVRALHSAHVKRKLARTGRSFIY